MNTIGITIGIIVGSILYKLTHRHQETDFSDGMIAGTIITFIVYLI